MRSKRRCAATPGSAPGSNPWEAQNEAIRLAFGGAPRSRQVSPVGRPSNENNAAPKSAPPHKGEPLRSGAPLPPRLAPAPGPIGRWRATALGGFVFAVAAVSFCGGPDDPRQALMRRADAALRSAAAFADTRLDFVSDDPNAVSAWLSARFARIDAKRLAPPGWSLLGVRVVAGLNSAAALVLYEDAVGGRAALMLTPTDGQPDLPPTGERDSDETILAGAAHGFAYAAVGPTRSGVGALIPVAFGD